MNDWFHDCDARGRLSVWLSQVVPEWSIKDPDVTQLSGGSSASMYRITNENRSVVVRTAQFPPRPDSVRALEREGRVLKSLAATAVPHARYYGYCEDLKVIGTEFLATGFIEGWSGGGTPPNALSDSSSAQGPAYALIDVLADLHMVDYRTIGLDGFGRPNGFLERQVDQWSRLFRQHQSDDSKPLRALPEAKKIGAWLRNHTPLSAEHCLIHCDASFSNVMFANHPPPRVVALIDWEIATIGHPLIDLGRAIYPFPDDRGLPGVSMMKDHGGGPTRQSLARRYAERRGIETYALDYFMVLAMFKLAALIEPNYARAAMGLDKSGFSARVAAFVPQLLCGASAIIDLHQAGEHLS